MDIIAEFDVFLYNIFLFKNEHIMSSNLLQIDIISGAWLTMGNVELHLIKGIPVDNLQVAHIAIETTNVNEVIYKLRELNIDIRQSLSVTNSYKPKSKDKSRIIQYFLNDPDGYYLELCNCGVLTEFSFNKDPTIDYHEGIHNETVFESC
jgi:hypothetical protein